MVLIMESYIIKICKQRTKVQLHWTQYNLSTKKENEKSKKRYCCLKNLAVLFLILTNPLELKSTKSPRTHCKPAFLHEVVSANFSLLKGIHYKSSYNNCLRYCQNNERELKLSWILSNQINLPNHFWSFLSWFQYIS